MSPKGNDVGHTSGEQEMVTRDMRRTRYDKSHLSMKVGAIGSLQTLSCIPVVAGDSMTLDARVVMRLSTLRRNLYMDARVDLFAFYVPHRHIYGDDWVTFMKAGVDEATTFGGDTLASGVELQSTGLPAVYTTAVPKWLTRGPIQIWNRYFRDPTDAAGLLAENYFTTLTAGDPVLDYGLKCCHLKTMWNSAILSTLTTGDYSLPLVGGEVDLYTLTALQGKLRTEVARDWFATRYQDILKHSWDSLVNIDADKRPELIARSIQWLSGYDVDGTADANLGTYSGKGMSLCQLKFPKKFFPEHGAVWIMALVRFPPVHDDETHYLVTKPEPTYTQISGEPGLVSRLGPLELNATDVFMQAGSADLGDIPHSQWYRYHPNTAHHKYTTSAGHPFVDWTPTNRNRVIYINHDDYEGMFESVMLKHWNSQAHIRCIVDSFVPDPQRSIFAGTGAS